MTMRAVKPNVRSEGTARAVERICHSSDNALCRTDPIKLLFFVLRFSLRRCRSCPSTACLFSASLCYSTSGRVDGISLRGTCACRSGVPAYCVSKTSSRLNCWPLYAMEPLLRWNAVAFAFAQTLPARSLGRTPPQADGGGDMRRTRARHAVLLLCESGTAATDTNCHPVDCASAKAWKRSLPPYLRGWKEGCLVHSVRNGENDCACGCLGCTVHSMGVNRRAAKRE